MSSDISFHLADEMESALGEYAIKEETTLRNVRDKIRTMIRANRLTKEQKERVVKALGIRGF